MRAPVLIAAIPSLLVAQAAGAATLPCLTPAEVTAFTNFALPGAISATTQRCSPTLGQDAYLVKRGNALAQRYAPIKAKAWPAAKAALLRLADAGDDPMLKAAKNIPDETLQQLADGIAGAAVSSRIPVKRCATIDRALWLLDPLPAEATAELVALTFGLIAQGDNPKIGKLSICKA